MSLQFMERGVDEYFYFVDNRPEIQSYKPYKRVWQFSSAPRNSLGGERSQCHETCSQLVGILLASEWLATFSDQSQEEHFQPSESGDEDSSIHLGCDQKVISPFCSKQWNGIIPVSCCCLLLLVVALWCSRRPLSIQSVSLSFPSPFLV